MAKSDTTTPTPPEAAAGAAESGPIKDARGRITNTPMTAEDAAKRVRRMVAKTNEQGEIVRDRNGNPVAVPQKIDAKEVMSFADYGDRVVVVTTAGEKLESVD